MPNSRLPSIYIIDDNVAHREALSTYLSIHSFRTLTFESADEFLDKVFELSDIDLLISDINMPGSSGFDLCRKVRAREAKLGREHVRIPIVLMTGSDTPSEKSEGLDAGADEFVGKPYSVRDLVAKMRSLLLIRGKQLETVRELQASYAKTGRLEQLQQFLSPNIASLLSVGGHSELLKPHRAEVTVLFVDLRAFTSFSERAAPEEVLEVLAGYYLAVGNAAIKHGGTLGHLAGDGIMIFFNDPEPIEGHRAVALRMALEAREALVEQRKTWIDRNYGIDFGMGLSEGEATIGGIGFDRYSQYTVIGGVSNFASRLCQTAQHGQLLISHRFLAQLPEGTCDVEAIGATPLKGIEKAVSLFNVRSGSPQTKAEAL